MQMDATQEEVRVDDDPADNNFILYYFISILAVDRAQRQENEKSEKNRKKNSNTKSEMPYWVCVGRRMLIAGNTDTLQKAPMQERRA